MSYSKRILKIGIPSLSKLAKLNMFNSYSTNGSSASTRNATISCRAGRRNSSSYKCTCILSIQTTQEKKIQFRRHGSELWGGGTIYPRILFRGSNMTRTRNCRWRCIILCNRQIWGDRRSLRVITTRMESRHFNIPSTVLWKIKLRSEKLKARSNWIMRLSRHNMKNLMVVLLTLWICQQLGSDRNGSKIKK